MLDKESSVRSVERALEILNCFDQNLPELSLVEISQRVSLAPSTASRIITTLERHNYLARNRDNKKYYLGPKIAQLGASSYSHLDFCKIAIHYMVALRDLFNESISLYVVHGESRVCIERVESLQALRRVVNIGDRLPLTKGAPGRLLLAYMPSERRHAILSKDTGLSETRLKEVCTVGYAVSEGEREHGVSSIAAPILDARNNVIAALNMSGPTVRFPPESMAEKISAVVTCAKKISQALGHNV